MSFILFSFLWYYQKVIGESYSGSMHALGACGLGSTPSSPNLKEYRVVISEESLDDKRVFDLVKIVSTKIKSVTPRHSTLDLICGLEEVVYMNEIIF